MKKLCALIVLFVFIFSGCTNSNLTSDTEKIKTYDFEYISVGVPSSWSYTNDGYNCYFSPKESDNTFYITSTETLSEDFNSSELNSHLEDLQDSNNFKELSKKEITLSNRKYYYYNYTYTADLDNKDYYVEEYSTFYKFTLYTLVFESSGSSRYDGFNNQETIITSVKYNETVKETQLIEDEDKETKPKEYEAVSTKNLYDYYEDYEYENIKTTIKITGINASGDTCAYTVYDLDSYETVKVKVTNIDTKRKLKKGDYLTVSGLCNYNSTYSDLIIEINADKINKTSKKLFKSLGSEKKIPQEYKNALETADSYANIQHMSKARLYRQLTSEYGEKFPAAAAQYAVDNVKTNWKKNALKTGKSYYLNQHMSKDRVYQQLISEYGEQFTPDEAQYAVDHLDD